MFCCVGATYSLVPYAAHKCFGNENFGVAYGSIMLSVVSFLEVIYGSSNSHLQYFQFISGIITALNSQYLLDVVGFHTMFTTVATTMFVSLLLTIYLPHTVYGSRIS